MFFFIADVKKCLFGLRCVYPVVSLEYLSDHFFSVFQLNGQNELGLGSLLKFVRVYKILCSFFIQCN